MEKITVDKAELLEILERNRDQHRAVFEEALTGFKEKVVKDLEQWIADIRAGRTVTDVRIIRLAPRDHTRDYDRAIEMIKMSLADTVELTEKDFQFYVQDDWGWQREFLANARTYNSPRAEALTVDYYEVD